MRSLLLIVLGLTSAALQWGAPVSAPEASVWYRGNPAGTPRPQDLEEIRAVGFSAVTWPESSRSHLETLRKTALAAGLDVIFRPSSKFLTSAAALTPGEFVDLNVADPSVVPLAWRAIAHGTRVISFDPAPEGGRLLDTSGARVAWVARVSDFLRQLRTNRDLFAQCRSGPALRHDAALPLGLDLVLLEARKSWVLIATNVSAVRVHASAQLPRGAPYALWLNLRDGTTMAMLEQADGPKWIADIDARGVRIYVIDKTLR